MLMRGAVPGHCSAPRPAACKLPADTHETGTAGAAIVPSGYAVRCVAKSVHGRREGAVD